MCCIQLSQKRVANGSTTMIRYFRVSLVGEPDKPEKTIGLDRQKADGKRN